MADASPAFPSASIPPARGLPHRLRHISSDTSRLNDKLSPIHGLDQAILPAPAWDDSQRAGPLGQFPLVSILPSPVKPGASNETSMNTPTGKDLRNRNPWYRKDNQDEIDMLKPAHNVQWLRWLLIILAAIIVVSLTSWFIWRALSNPLSQLPGNLTPKNGSASNYLSPGQGSSSNHCSTDYFLSRGKCITCSRGATWDGTNCIRSVSQVMAPIIEPKGRMEDVQASKTAPASLPTHLLGLKRLTI